MPDAELTSAQARWVLRGMVRANAVEAARQLIDQEIRRRVAGGTSPQDMRDWHRLLLDAAAALGNDEDLKSMGWALRAFIIDSERHPPSEARLRARFTEAHPPYTREDGLQQKGQDA